MNVIIQLIVMHCHCTCALTGTYYRSQLVHTLDKNLKDDQSHEVTSCISLDVGPVSCSASYVGSKLVKHLLHNHSYLGEHVLINGNTKVDYIPLVKLSPYDRSKDYWTYDGRYCHMFFY